MVKIEDNTVSKSNIFLTIVCCLILVASFIFNFTFLVTLLKLRRLNRIDKSNYLLTHLIFADFLCSFFILVPSGYAVYNSNMLGFDGCRVQTFFTTFFFTITFHGLFVLTIERFIKYQFPVWHINHLSKRLYYDQEENETQNVTSASSGRKVFFVIIGIWLIDIFIAFIPFFGNYNDIQYFKSQTQCDYIYENFNWWIWLFFWVSIVIPFIGGLIFSILTIRNIFITDRRIEIRINSDKEIGVSNKNQSERIIEGLDITMQPANRAFYEHIINPDEGKDDFHVRNQLLAQFKYKTEKSKTITFLIILILNFCLVFPIYVIHFYRTYSTKSTTLEDDEVVARSTYTAFAWISYLTIVAKSMVCLIQNKYYRHALYQSTNRRGFSGVFDFQKELKNLAIFDDRKPKP